MFEGHSMRIVVRYFAVARERVGIEREEIDVPEALRVGALMPLLAERHPQLAPLQGRLRIAVSQEFAQDDEIIPPGAEVALIPPVAGGAGRCRLSAEPLSLDEVVRAVSGPGRGGVVTFTGSVREQSQGKRVVRLDYEAYAPMAERKLEAIADEAKRLFDAEVSIVHRTGSLEIGELAVVIAAASAHRAAAFDACRFTIEALKRDVPIWKKEHYTDGESWVGMGP
jgi:molybdopterin synthase catalytic subunit